MRRFKSVLLILLLVSVVAEGAWLAWLVMDTDKINRVEFAKIDAQGKEILANLQRYDLKSASLNNEFPSVTPANWMQKLEDAVNKASAKLASHSGRPAIRLGNSDTREIRFSLTVTSEDLKSLFEVASQIEKIDPSGAVRVNSFVVSPRRTETAPLSCVIDVVIYERASTATPDETPEVIPGEMPDEAPVPEDLPDLVEPGI
jgi:hypothetical protein